MVPGQCGSAEGGGQGVRCTRCSCRGPEHASICKQPGHGGQRLHPSDRNSMWIRAHKAHRGWLAAEMRALRTYP
jgi:hypothetical protein